MMPESATTVGALAVASSLVANTSAHVGHSASTSASGIVEPPALCAAPLLPAPRLVDESHADAHSAHGSDNASATIDPRAPERALHRLFTALFWQTLLRISSMNTRRPPTSLGPFAVVGPLVAGGSSDVLAIAYKGERAAAKWLLRELAADPHARASFEHEATLLCHCRAPGLPTLLGRELVDERPVIVSRWIEGNPLDIRDTRSLSEALALGRSLLRALDALHGIADDVGPLGVVHRDVNPSNIIVSDELDVTLVDFGLASSRLLPRSADALNEGTLGYHAPEMFTGAAPIDARSDVFCAAIVLWELLASRPLFSRSKFAAAHEIVETEARDVREARGDVPEWLAGVIARALSRRAIDRFASALEFERALGARIDDR